MYIAYLQQHVGETADVSIVEGYTAAQLHTTHLGLAHQDELARRTFGLERLELAVHPT